MKIERRIILSNAFNLALIVLTGVFAFQNLDQLLTKLRFVELADDLNASFLEMRLSEKNYFLYRDKTALLDISNKIDKTMQSIEFARKDIIRAVGENNFRILLSHLNSYSAALEDVHKKNTGDLEPETKFRAEGKKLKEFSETITRLERARVNEIISSSKKVMIYLFLAILLSAILVSHLVSQKILKALRQIERLAKSISNGNFNKIETATSGDELGSVIKAINSMSEELKNREDEIIQSKKLASLGTLTAGVSHELTNPVNNISMIAQTYLELYDKLTREDRIEFMGKVEAETERIKGIVKNLLDFSKPKSANLEEADINAIINKTLSLVQNMLDISNIETKLNLEEGITHVLIDIHQIQQVLVNLVVNAVYAMPPKGKLTIITRSGKNREFVEVEMQDTGKGIPPEILPHIFDPFFSTKGVDGTGLGLSVSYGIIKNHKGNIKVESKVGVGTSFIIELPIYKKGEEKNESV